MCFYSVNLSVFNRKNWDVFCETDMEFWVCHPSSMKNIKTTIPPTQQAKSIDSTKMDDPIEPNVFFISSIALEQFQTLTSTESLLINLSIDFLLLPRRNLIGELRHASLWITQCIYFWLSVVHTLIASPYSILSLSWLLPTNESHSLIITPRHYCHLASWNSICDLSMYSLFHALSKSREPHSSLHSYH